MSSNATSTEALQDLVSVIINGLAQLPTTLETTLLPVLQEIWTQGHPLLCEGAATAWGTSVYLVGIGWEVFKQSVGEDNSEAIVQIFLGALMATMLLRFWG